MRVDRVRRHSFLLGWLLATALAQATPARRAFFQLTQPDGSSFTAELLGDEWQNALVTKEGYAIKRKSDSYFYYADFASRDVSGKRVGRDLPPKFAAFSGFSKMRAVPRAPKKKVATGNQPLLVLLVSFSDRAISTSLSYWQTIFFTGSKSVKAYYAENSYQKLSLLPASESCGTINDGIVSVTLATPHPNPGSSVDSRNQQITKDALLAADSCTDFQSFDLNGDGVLSSSELHIVVVVAGFEASFFPDSPSIWAHNWCLFQTVPPPILDGVQVGGCAQEGYIQMGELHHDHPATIGIPAHELGHDLGEIDLYDLDGSSFGVGDWSVMGTGNWRGTLPADSPVQFDPYSKALFGWISPKLIQEPASKVSFPPVETATDSSGGVVQLLANPGGFEIGGTGEYFLIENRQPLGFDSELPGSGLLIWHVDETRTTNTDETHKLLDLEEADGLKQLDFATSPGDSGDPYPGSRSNTAFTASSNPNSLLYSGSSSGVSVTGITAGDPFQADIAVPDTQPPSAPTLLTPADGSQVNSVKPTFDWTDVSDPSGVQYTLQVDNNSDFSSPELTASNLTQSTFTAGAPLAPGTYFFRVQAQDGAGNIGSYSSSFTFTLIQLNDTSPPAAPPAVRDGLTPPDLAFQSDTTTLSANYDVSSDPESGVVRYWVSIGTAPSATDVLNWTNNGLNLTFTQSGLTLQSNKTYYVNVRAENGAGLLSLVTSSNGVTIDTTPPQGVAVSDGLTGNLDSQTEGTQLSANWTSSSDAESGIVRYWLSFGTAPQKTDIVPWTDVGLQTSFTATGLTLNNGVRYYANVQAENGAKLLSSIASSDGVTFLYLPPSPPPTLTATPQEGSVHLNWGASSPKSFPISAYLVLRATASGGPYTLIATLSSTTLQYTDTTASTRVPYYYVVQAQDSSQGVSANSPEAHGFSFSSLSPGAPKIGVTTSLSRRMASGGPAALFLKWTTNTAGSAGKFSSSSFDQVTLATATGDLQLFQNGQQTQSYAAGSPPQEPPILLADGGSFLLTQDGCLHAISPLFTLLYKNCSSFQTATLTTSGKTLIASTPTQLLFLDADGTQEKALNLSAPLLPPLALSPSEDKLFALDSLGNLQGFDLTQQALLFTLPLASPTTFHGLAVTGGGDVVVAVDATLYFITPAGALLKTLSLTATARGIAVTSTDQVAVSSDTSLTLFQPDGTPLNQLSLTSSPTPPVLDKNDNIYIGDAAGIIASYSPQLTLRFQSSPLSLPIAEIGLTSEGNLLARTSDQLSFFQATNIAAPSFVFDGGAQDQDFQASTTSYSATWGSVPGALSYEVGVGTGPLFPNFLSYSDVGNVTTTTLSLTLQDKTTYYFFVRAKDASGAVGDAAVSNGLTIDTTPPDPPQVTDGGVATSDPTSLSYSISASDPESGIADYLVGVGLTPTTPDIFPLTSTGGQSSGVLTNLSLKDGTLYYILAQAVNGASATSALSASNGITVDTTPPTLSTQTLDIGSTTATLTLTLSEPASVSLQYGTSSSSLSKTVTLPSLLREQTLTLTGLTANTQYFYQLTLTDLVGHKTTTSIFSFQTALSLSLTLKTGRALLTFPEKKSESIQTLLQLPAGTQIAVWDALSQSFSIPSGPQDPLSFPDAGKGFLLNLPSDWSLSTSFASSATASFSLQPGWNLIGSVKSVPISLYDLTATCNGTTLSLSNASAQGLVGGFAWGYDNALDSFSLIYPPLGGGATTQLQPGEAYFFFASAPCTLNFPAQPLKARAPQLPPPLLQIELHTKSGSDLFNFLASSGLSIPKPPGEGPQLAFLRGRERLSTLSAPQGSATFEVKAPPGTEVELKLRPAPSVQVVLSDLQSHQSLQLISGSYRYTQSSETTLFRVAFSEKPKPEPFSLLSATLYPNPVSRTLPALRFRVKGKLDSLQLEIYTATGGRVATSLFAAPKAEAPLPQLLTLANGVYFYRAIFRSGATVAEKIGKLVILK